MKKAFAVILLGVWTLRVGAPSVFAATESTYLVSTLPAWNGTSVIGPMSEMADYSATFATCGQTFRTPADHPVLQQFSFWLEGLALYPDPMHFGGYLMAWDGLKATGSVLYKSAEQTAVLGQLRRFDFNLGLTLEPDQSYVFFISCSEYYNGLTSKSYPGSIVTNPYPDGDMVTLRNGPNFSLIPSTSWSQSIGWDAAFEALFAQVPEPTTVRLLGLGLLVLVTTTRRSLA